MVTGLLHIPQASLPSSYLGVPLFFGSSRHSHFNHWLNYMRSRLQGRKTKCLSFAGRLILVKHVLASIPLRISLVIPIPIKSCNLIERLMRNLLWLANLDKVRSNYVRWEFVCLPKVEGGLGLRRMKDLNAACMLRLGWSTATFESL